MVAAIPVPPRIIDDIKTSDARNLKLFLQNVKERLDIAINTNTDLTNQSILLRQQVAALNAATDPIAFTKFFESPETSISGTEITIAHGLATLPKLLNVFIRNKTIEANYAVGDEASPFPYSNGISASGSVSWDSTNIYISFSGSGIQLNNKTTGVAFTVTPANWKIVARAWV
jgi:hypothetical protein